MMWIKLDEVMDDLVEGESEHPELDRGFALGVAVCIAIVEDPYHQDVDKIRAKAMERRIERERAESAKEEAEEA